MNSLKERTSSRSQKLFLLDTALFEVNLTLQVPNVEITPSLEEIQLTINEAANNVKNVLQGIYDWGVGSQGAPKTRYIRVLFPLCCLRVCVLACACGRTVNFASVRVRAEKQTPFFECPPPPHKTNR